MKYARYWKNTDLGIIVSFRADADCVADFVEMADEALVDCCKEEGVADPSDFVACLAPVNYDCSVQPEEEVVTIPSMSKGNYCVTLSIDVTLDLESQSLIDAIRSGFSYVENCIEVGDDAQKVTEVKFKDAIGELVGSTLDYLVDAI